MFFFLELLNKVDQWEERRDEYINSINSFHGKDERVNIAYALYVACDYVEFDIFVGTIVVTMARPL